METSLSARTSDPDEDFKGELSHPVIHDEC
jgi:hypothetical protein